jgi:YVTN family beta-propeller protein
VLTRRSVLLAGLGLPLACARRKAQGFSGYAFIANQEGRAVAAVDLTVFAVARHIRLDGAPTAAAADGRGGRVYALTPENGSVHEIRTDNLTFARKLQVANSALAMRLSPDGEFLYVLSKAPRRLVRVALDAWKVDWQLTLPAEPVDFDLERVNGELVAISYSVAHAISLVETRNRQVSAFSPAGGDIGAVRFRGDGKQLIAADLSGRMLSMFDVERRKLQVNLPLAVRPNQLCFSADGGQLFVTGDGMDAVVVVYPYYTPEVAETVLAGHTPGAMAASAGPDDGYLFVANPTSGDVSIVDIRTRKVLAVTPVGTAPGFVVITPDDKYALVLNQASGDMAVIRIANITRTVNEQRRWRKGALFMLIPVGSKPVSAAIVAI